MVEKIVVKYLIFFLYLQTSSAVIYYLNDTEYKKMPPVFRADSYEECMWDPHGLYCTTDLVLVSDAESPLLDVIREYTAYAKTHYNHTLLRYNLCVSRICEGINSTTADPRENLEACLNKTMQDRYGLKVKVQETIRCKKAGDKTEVEAADIVVLGILIGILMLNIVGSLYDFCYTNGEKGQGLPLLTAFSIRRNWRKLVAPALEGPERRLRRLKVISSVKCITTMLVILAHALLPSFFYIDNTKFAEDLVSKVSSQILFNGPIAVQTFFVLSGLLLSYNLELMAENSRFKVNWLLLPKGVILRWIRLTPPYALMLFFVVTCNKYLIEGSAFWQTAMMAEVEDCKKYWWQHLLYINNYNDQSQCMLHTWYLAADTQLYCLGLIIYIACRSPVSRKVVLSFFMVTGIIIPMVQTYLLDLDGIFVCTPEAIVHFFITNISFNNLHKRAYTNISSYMVGLSIGFLAYHGQRVDYNVERLKKYRVLFYGMVPAGFAVVMSASVFYREGPRPALPVRLLFAAYQKPAWSLLLAIGMLGCMFKYENFIRGIAEWQQWTPLSRLSYCAYITHVNIIRAFIGNEALLSHLTVASMAGRTFLILVVSYLVAFPCWMLIEQPLGQMLKVELSQKEKETERRDIMKPIVTNATMDNTKIIIDQQMTRV